VELHPYSPIRLHGMLLSRVYGVFMAWYLVKQRGKFALSVYYFLIVSIHFQPFANFKPPNSAGIQHPCLSYYSNFFILTCDSSVGIALGYGLDDRGSMVRFSTGVGNFSLHHRVQNGSGAHPASYPMGTRGSFPGGKAAGA
jgi:hypothetical protein